MAEKVDIIRLTLDKYLYQTQLFRKVSLLHYCFTYKNIILLSFVCYAFFKFDMKAKFVITVLVVAYIFGSFKNIFSTYTFKISKEEKTFFNFYANLTKKYYLTRHNAFKKEALLAEELLYKEPKIKKSKGKKK